MFKFIKKLLSKGDTPPAATPATAGSAPAPADSTPSASSDLLQGMANVEVAHLSLLAILQKLPAELSNMVAQMPDASATVALPVSTIQKQLATGSVKMSLASLYRQAPAGTFTLKGAEDRRMVEVPLSEVFRHVKPQVLRRKDQRRVDLPEDAVALFGNKENPYAMEPAVPDGEAFTGYRPNAEPEPKVQPPRVLKPDFDLSGQPNGNHSAAPSSLPAERKIAPPSFAAGAASAPVHEEPLKLEIKSLADGWPEPIRSESLAMDGVLVALPAGSVTAGLAKGKITFTWGQMRSWMDPAPAQPGDGADGTELTLPLKVVAPAFLKHSKPAMQNRRSYQMDESIPALFSGANAPAEAPAPPAPAEVRSGAVPAQVELPAIPPPVFPDAAAPAEQQAVVAETKLPPPPSMLPKPEEAQPAGTGHFVSPLSRAALADPASARKLGELLGDADKAQWSPGELVKATARFPNVAGAIIGLQEGFPVAAELPENIKADTVAAFLPQIFARLTNYATEMGLGQVGDLLTTVNGAHLQIHRFGEVYYGVLGKPGEALPWEQLSLVVAELARQHRS